MATATSRVPDPEAYEDPLDSYSATVIRVAAAVTPHVAALEVTGTGRSGRFRMGAGSAVLFTSDGYLLTNAHVVGGASGSWSWPSGTPGTFGRGDRRSCKRTGRIHPGLGRS